MRLISGSVTIVLMLAAASVLALTGCEPVAGDDADADMTQQCNNTVSTGCSADDPTRVFALDACGQITGVREECTNGEVCQQRTPTSLATCESATGCGTSLDKACDPSDLSKVFYLDSCGNIDPARVFDECAADTECRLETGSSTPHCVSTAQCTNTLDKACDDNDLSKVFYLDSCGNIDPARVFDECTADTECRLEAGSSTPRCVSTTPVCTTTLDKVCTEDDLTAVYYIDSCGELDGVFEQCDAAAGEVCTIDPANFVPQCRVPCWPVRSTISCAEDLRSSEWVNACGELSGETVATCAADEECSFGQCHTIVDPCAPERYLKTCDPADVTKTWWTNACGDLTGEVADDCAASGQSCGGGGQCITGCTEPISTACVNDGAATASPLLGESTIRETDACGAATSVVLETCAIGELCSTRGGVPTCLNSMTDETSPWYTKACSFGMFLDAQTDLPMDCRCRKDMASDPTAPNGSIVNCWTVEQAWGEGLRQAAGPHLYPIEPRVFGGVLSPAHGEIFSAQQFTDPSYTDAGLIVAYDYTTGDRRIVSGRYNDPAAGYVVYGSGYESRRMVSGVPRELTILNGINDIELGSDGFLYTYGNTTLENVEIVRVHPDTGERTLVWRTEQRDGSVSPFGQCYGTRTINTTASGLIAVQYEKRAFAMDPATGKFYIGFRNPSDGVGVVEISADGSTCRFVTRTFAENLPDIGSGFTQQYTSLAGMHVRDGKVYVVYILQEALVAVDIATGQRTPVSIAGVLGEGDHAMGENNIFWDDSRQLMWVMGQVAPFLGFAVDLVTGERDNVYRITAGGLLPGEYPAEQGHAGALRNGNYVGYGTAALHPVDNDILYLVGRKGEMYEYEISTGNSWIKSL